MIPYKVIWLQVYGCDADELPADRSEWSEQDEVTWCQSRIYDTDVKYVLAEDDK